jgi:hypothetical protein
MSAISRGSQAGHIPWERVREDRKARGVLSFFHLPFASRILPQYMQTLTNRANPIFRPSN